VRRAAAVTFLFLVSGASLADDAGLLRCRAVADSPARLACYDALAREVEGRFGKPQAAAPVPAQPSAAPASPAAPARASPPQTVANFGLENRQAPELNAIQSTIPGLFQGWGPNARIQLANGQVWQISDNSSAYLYRQDPKVSVRRGALGSFFLDIENDNRSPRVRRVQ
jgi:hypothetical protein